jgi:hypothetical protein
MIPFSSVPDGDFEAQVESDSPPTVTALAEQGTQKKPLHDHSLPVVRLPGICLEAGSQVPFEQGRQLCLRTLPETIGLFNCTPSWPLSADLP